MNKSKKGLAITALVLGLVSLMLFLFVFNILTGGIAIVLAIIYLATHEGKDGKVMATIGLISAVLSIALLIISWILISSNARGLLPIYKEMLVNNGIDVESDYPELQLDLDVEDTL